jgi:hypothetical protein
MIYVYHERMRAALLVPRMWSSSVRLGVVFETNGYESNTFRSVRDAGHCTQQRPRTWTQSGEDDENGICDPLRDPARTVI